MANMKHVEILKQGVQVWNRWRVENPDIRPDLSEAILPGLALSGVNLEWATLTLAELPEAKLTEANLFAASAEGATFTGADLTRANLNSADLFQALLDNSILVNADLTLANLTWARLDRADLSGAWLHMANLNGAQLRGTDLSYCLAQHTIFTDTDLSGVKGLEKVDHIGPSTIGIDTLYRSKGKIPEAFLRGCGVPEQFISYARAAIAPSQYYSCFVSCSFSDEEFANRLVTDLQNVGVRCWFAPQDLKAGDDIRVSLDSAIAAADKVLLVLSKHSVGSKWVRREVEKAIEKERTTGKTIVFPVRVDDAILQTSDPWALGLRTRVIGDFREWRDQVCYQKVFSNLVRALTISAATEANERRR